MKFSDFLREQKEKHAVLAFGRMNPITSGHEKLVNTVKSIAKDVGGSHHIVLSHSQDKDKNPLSGAQKVKHAKRAFPNTNFSVSTKEHPNFLKQAEKLHKSGVTHLHMVGGSDRVKEFKDTLHKYNGTHEGALFNFKNIKVHSAGERDPDAEGTTGISASKMRAHAKTGNFEHFKKGAPASMSHEHIKHMYHDVRKGMGLQENIDEDFEELLGEGVHDKSIFKAVFLAGGPGSGKDYVLSNTLDGHGLVEINSDKALEFLMDKKGLDKTMPSSEKEIRDVVRGKAKSMTELRQKLALLGRNGLIINGTGDDVEKIQKIKDSLEELGYDTSMIMVNTDNEISAQRNVERGQRGGRTVPENIRREKWEAVQNSRPELAKLFGQNYMEFDNSEDLRNAAPEVVKAKKDELLSLYKNIQQFTTTPPQSPAAEMWVAHEMNKTDSLPVPEGGAELVPHHGSAAAEEAKKLGLQYYGFGRYGKNGKVTYRSVHDKLVQVIENQPKNVNEEFEELIGEDLRNWFNPKHPDGGWKRINSKGEAVGPCAREPGEAKPKCMSNKKRAQLNKKERASAVAAKRRHDPVADRAGKGGKPVNVSNFGKGKISESHQIDESKQTKQNFLKDKNGKVKTFMLRSAAAKEAHTKNGIVMPYKNGYVIKLNEENENVTIANQLIQKETRCSTGNFTESSIDSTNIESGLIEGNCGATQEQSCDCGCGGGETSETGSKGKITLQQIRSKQKEKVKESIDKGIEPGLSMASSGENMGRGVLKTKQIKKPLEETIGAGGEDVTSLSDYNENDLKRKGINIKTFKSKKSI